MARLLKPHALAGEIETKPLTSFADRLLVGRRLLLSPTVEDRREVTIESVRTKKHNLLIKFEGIDTLEDAVKLRGCLLVLPVAELSELDSNEYYHHELLGMRVVTTDGRDLGAIAEILETGANDVYVVRGEAGEALIPAIRSVVKSVDVDAALMTIEPMPGLLPEPIDEN